MRFGFYVPGTEGKVFCFERPALKVIRASTDVKLAHFAAPAELGNSVNVNTGRSFLQVHQHVRGRGRW